MGAAIKGFRNSGRAAYGKKERILSFLIAAIISAVSTWTVFFRVNETKHAFLPQHTSILSVAGIFLLFFAVLLLWCFCVPRKKSWRALITASIISFFYVLGTFVLQDLDSLESISVSRVLIRFAGIFPVLYGVANVLFSGLDHYSAKELSLDRKQLRLYFGFAIFLLWLPYLAGCFPGNLTGDTMKSVQSFQDPVQGQNVPWFLNLLHGGILWLGERIGNADLALFVFCLAQALLFILGLADMFSQLWAGGVPQGLVITLVVLFGAFPVFPTYAFCMMKDSAFALGILYFCDAGLRILTEKGTERKNWLLLAVSAFLTSLVRNGAPLMMILSMTGFFVLFRKKRVFLMAVAAGILLISYGIPKLAGFPASQIRESLSLPIQQTARVIKLQEEKLSEAELKQYRKIMTLKHWRRYKPGISDPVKQHFPEDASPGDLKRFFSLWGTELKNYPRTYLDATVLMTYAYYVPPADRSDLKVRLFLGTQRFSAEKVEGMTSLSENQNPGLEIIQKVYDFLNGIPVIRLFLRIGLYTWLLTAALIYSLGTPGKRRMSLLLVPEIIVLIGCCFSPVNGHFRYAFPFIVSGSLVSMAVFFMKGKTDPDVLKSR